MTPSYSSPFGSHPSQSCKMTWLSRGSSRSLASGLAWTNHDVPYWISLWKVPSTHWDPLIFVDSTSIFELVSLDAVPLSSAPLESSIPAGDGFTRAVYGSILAVAFSWLILVSLSILVVGPLLAFFAPQVFFIIIFWGILSVWLILLTNTCLPSFSS